MNHHEAAAVMARIVDTWPAGKWPNGTISEWTKDLLELDKTAAEKARVALKKSYADLGRGLYPQPSWATFLAAYKGALPRPEWQPPLDDPPVSAERAREHLAECRAILTKSRPT